MNTNLRSVAWLAVASLLVVRSACAQNLLFTENFDGLPLGPPIDEQIVFPEAFTHDPPDGWIRDASDVPGVGDPDIGIEEWEGWSFADRDFWILAADDERRSEFTRGRNTIAVADPDEWNDLGDPANFVGFYNTILSTPKIDVTSVTPGAPVKLAFDSSWIPQCCDDGESFDPNGNNKTAIVRAIVDGGSPVEVLRWESDPQSTFFKEDATNESVLLDLSSVLFSGNHDSMRLEFLLIDAGDDWWWGFDNVQMFSLSTLLGDMNLNGFLDSGDVDAFALGLRSTFAYRQNFYGEFPVTRGSNDPVFDYDDIDWFVEILNNGGVATSVGEVLAAINGIPEPATGTMLCLGVALLLAARRRLVVSKLHAAPGRPW